VKLEKTTVPPNPSGCGLECGLQHNQFRKEKLWTEKTAGDPASAIEFADDARSLGGGERYPPKVRSEDYRYAILRFYRINAQCASGRCAKAFGNSLQDHGSVRFLTARGQNVIAYCVLVTNPPLPGLKRISTFRRAAWGKRVLEAIQKFGVREPVTLFNALEQAAQIRGINAARQSLRDRVSRPASTYIAKKRF